MPGSGSFAVSRSHGGDRFYNPPAIRRHLQELQQQRLQREHQQIQRPVKLKSSAAAENRILTDDSKPTSACSSSHRRLPTNVTNLDRLLEYVTPSVPALYFSEENVSSYNLGDLWDSFKEWSVYGVGVPLLLNGKDSIVQYYVPSLSGIQLYVDSWKSSSRFRSPGENGDVESSRETSSVGSSDCEADRQAKYVMDGSPNQQSPMNSNSGRITGLPSREKSLTSSSSDETEICTSPGTLAFEYLEKENPYNRKPLNDMVTDLVSQFPDLRKYRSSDLLPASWISVAWYPIYRIPMGLTLRNLDASFLMFHSLSTQFRSNGEPRVLDVNGTSKASVPVFGLASYNLNGSILTPSGPSESQQANSLLHAADKWLRSLQVVLPDYVFFRTRYSEWR